MPDPVSAQPWWEKLLPAPFQATKWWELGQAVGEGRFPGTQSSTDP
ncbi:hypothetical protein LCGC14_2972100, partial [marine sediment metagenome]